MVNKMGCLIKSELENQIRKVFFYEKRFKKEEIAYIHPKYKDYEGTTVATEFAGKSNGELVCEHESGLYLHAGAISFINSSALAYFIGSLMYIALNDTIGLISEDVCFFLTSSLNEDSMVEFIDELTEEKVDVIIKFLEYLNEYEGSELIRSALLGWKNLKK